MTLSRKTPLRGKPRKRKSIAERTAIARKARKPWKRKPSSFARIYGSQRRAKLMKTRPCDTCGRHPTEDEPNVNSHVGPADEKGTGYKAGWEWVITQCDGCHRVLGWLGSVERFDEARGCDCRAIARRLAIEIPQDGKLAA